MNRFVAVLKSDIIHAFRDPTLVLVLFSPLLIIFAVRTAFPLLLEYVPQAADYRKEVISFFVLISAFLPGMIMSFILLDEKDAHLFSVIKVTPVSLSGFFCVRLVFMVFTGMIMSLLVMLFNGIYTLSLIKSLQVSLLAGLNSPIIIMPVSCIARNKIEGLTYIKASTVTLIIPITIFFMNSGWKYLFVIFPGFWVYGYFDTQCSFLFFLGGLFFLGILNYFMFKLVRRMPLY